MATQKVVNRGLQVFVGRGFNTGDSFAAIQSVSVDDSSNAFGATDTALNSGGAVTNEADTDFNSTPTRSSQTVTWAGTFGLAVSLTIRRIAIHNAAATSVTTSSTTLVAGTAGRNLVKDTDFTLTITGTVTLADNS